jgi:ERCC4-type nuclease
MDFIVVTDSREQKPFQFPETKTIVAALPAGDYSVSGFEHSIAIERKSLQDLYQSLTWERDRFEREIERLRDYEFSAVVIEADWLAIAAPMGVFPFWDNRTNPKSIIGTILTWSIRYPRTVWLPMPNRSYAERITLRILEKFYKEKTKEARRFQQGKIDGQYD